MRWLILCQIFVLVVMGLSVFVQSTYYSLERNNNFHRDLRRRRKKDMASLLKHAENTDPHYVKTSDWWEVNHPFLSKFAGFHNQTMHLFLRRYDFDNSITHSCYQYRLEEFVPKENTTKFYDNTFCYPSIMITGVPKCSTSAVYHLLRSFDHSRNLLAKEVCPGMFYFANLNNFFDALSYVANDGTLGRHEFIVNACIELDQNIAMHEILRQPKTFYIAMVRDYADWLWSSYNYWCMDKYDADCDPITHWVNAEIHHRSPEHFHRLMLAERSKVENTDKSYLKPISVVFEENICLNAKSVFSSYVHALWTKMGVENTLIFASEQLERDPAAIVSKLVDVIGFSHLHVNIEEFQSVRYNTNKKAGENNVESASEYRPGLYNISGYRPIFQETRQYLNMCWQPDCQWTSLVTGFPYNCSTETDSVAKERIISAAKAIIN